MLEAGHYQPQDKTIVVCGTSNTTLIHETDHRINDAENSPPKRSPYQLTSALAQLLGSATSTYTFGSLLLHDISGSPLLPPAEFMAGASISLMLMAGSTAIYLLDPLERRARHAQRKITTQFIKVVDTLPA